MSDSAARMGGEPPAAQRGLEELAAMLIAAHGVVAQLSAARIALQAADPAEADQARVEAAAARRWLSDELAAGGAAAGEAAIDRAAPFAALKRATRRLVAAAGAYRGSGGEASRSGDGLDIVWQRSAPRRFCRASVLSAACRAENFRFVFSRAVCGLASSSSRAGAAMRAGGAGAGAAAISARP